MTIAAGKLTETISIMRFTESDDGYQTIRDYVPIRSLPASVTPLSDREIFTAAAAQTAVSHRVTVRLVPSVTVQTTDRVLYNGESYDVRTVRLFPRQGFAEITIGRV